MRDVYESIVQFRGGKRQIALLLDPDKQSAVDVKRVLGLANRSSISFVLVGGSLVN